MYMVVGSSGDVELSGKVLTLQDDYAAKEIELASLQHGIMGQLGAGGAVL